MIRFIVSDVDMMADCVDPDYDNDRTNDPIWGVGACGSAPPDTLPACP